MKHYHPRSAPRGFAVAPGAAVLLLAIAALLLPSTHAVWCCSWDGGNNCGELCGNDATSWCHEASENCLNACQGTHWIDGTPIDNCGETNTCTMPDGIPDNAADVDNTGFATAHGKLKLGGTNGVQLVDAFGQPVQLMGMSSHGLHWFPSCYTKASIQYQVEHWGINLFRAAMYVGEGGYASDPSVKQQVKDIVQWCKELGIYAMIDWHVLTPGNPNDGVYSGAVAFFEEMANLYKDETHVLYEIANEPNGVAWTGVNGVKSYADNMIAKIRAIDAETIIIVGTPTWSQEIDKPAADPVAAPHNVMYAFHFYAGTHIHLLNRVLTYAPSLPIFVTEWGTSEASGNNGPYLANAKAFLDTFNDISGTGIKLSWAQWSYADKSETSAALNSGACGNQDWDNTSCSGTFVKNYIKSHIDTASGLSTTTTTTAAPPTSTTVAPTTLVTTTPATTTTAAPTTTTTAAPTTTTTAAPTTTTTTTTTAAPTTTTTTAAPTTTTTSMSTAASTTTTTTTAATITTTACVALYGQCGGMNHNGGTTCCAGSVCVKSDDYYSQCKPDTSSGGNCVAWYGQCGGMNYNGETACCAGSSCEYINDYYSQCIPPNRMLRGGKV